MQQKSLFLENLMSKSVSSQTIESSGNGQSKAQLEKARALVAAAKEDLQKNRTAEADAKLDQALALVNAETRTLSERRVAGERLKEAYDKRLKAVRTFITAYSRVAQEKGAGSSAAKETAALTKIVADAESLAAQGHMAEAKTKLDHAYTQTTAGLRQMRRGDTLVRSLKFESPKDEYEYELDRNESHQMLLKLALADNAPAPAQASQIEQIRMSAAKLRSEGERQGKSGDYKTAIKTLESSTTELLKAIRMSGLFIPG